MSKVDEILEACQEAGSRLRPGKNVVSPEVANAILGWVQGIGQFVAGMGINRESEVPVDDPDDLATLLINRAGVGSFAYTGNLDGDTFDIDFEGDESGRIIVTLDSREVIDAIEQETGI